MNETVKFRATVVIEDVWGVEPECDKVERIKELLKAYLKHEDHGDLDTVEIKDVELLNMNEHEHNDYDEGRKAHRQTGKICVHEMQKKPCSHPYCDCPDFNESVSIISNQPSPDLLLHLRFVVLKDAVVMERLVFKDEADILNGDALIMELNDSFDSPCVLFNDTPFSFPTLRTNLDQWANSLSDDKPVPRIEKVNVDGFSFYKFAYSTESSTLAPLSELEFKALEQIIGAPIPIHTPRTYRSEWIEPKRFDVGDFNNLLEGELTATQIVALRDDTQNINQQLADLPQVWEFKLWRD